MLADGPTPAGEAIDRAREAPGRHRNDPMLDAGLRRMPRLRPRDGRPLRRGAGAHPRRATASSTRPSRPTSRSEQVGGRRGDGVRPATWPAPSGELPAVFSSMRDARGDGTGGASAAGSRCSSRSCSATRAAGTRPPDTSPTARRSTARAGPGQDLLLLPLCRERSPCGAARRARPKPSSSSGRRSRSPIGAPG